MSITSTDIESVIDQVLGNASKHVETGQNVFHVVKDIGLILGWVWLATSSMEFQTYKVYFRLVAHETDDLYAFVRWVRGID